MTRLPHHHGHPHAWMTVLLAAAAALVILLMSFTVLQIATILQSNTIAQ